MSLTEPANIDAGARLRRLLAMLAYLAQVGEAPIAEVAERFSLSESLVIAELELAACCGLPPYTPDQLLELVIDEGKVTAYGLEALRRPPQLTADEGFVLAAAARALLGVSGSDPTGPLATALKKLEQVLGDGGVSVELDHPASLEILRRAAARGEFVEIEYLGANRGEQTTRVVEPYVVSAREGHFYLDGYCHQAADWRRFALERISAVRLTGEYGEPRHLPSEFGGTRAFAGGPSVKKARVAISANKRVLVERYATEIDSAKDGRVVLSIEVGDEHWFGRLLLGLGEDAEVLEPRELSGAAGRAARRALARYEDRTGR